MILGKSLLLGRDFLAFMNALGSSSGSQNECDLEPRRCTNGSAAVMGLGAVSLGGTPRFSSGGGRVSRWLRWSFNTSSVRLWATDSERLLDEEIEHSESDMAVAGFGR